MAAPKLTRDFGARGCAGSPGSDDTIREEYFREFAQEAAEGWMSVERLGGRPGGDQESLRRKRVSSV